MPCNCQISGPFKKYICGAKQKGFSFKPGDCCSCSCHLTDQDMWCKFCHKMNPCRYAPSPDAGPFWRCSECGEVVDE